MIPWIQVYSNLPQHPKTSRLADELGLSSAAVNPNVLAVGLLVSLWTWAIQNAYNGDLSGCSNRSIAEACLWKKKPETLVNALIKAGFLDADKKLHDWDEYACLLIDQEENRKAKTRDRVKRFRERKAAENSANSNGYCNGKCNVTETPCNASTRPYITIPDQTSIFSGDGGDARAREEIADFAAVRGMDPGAYFGLGPDIQAEVRAFTDAAFARYASRPATENDAAQAFLALYSNREDPQTHTWTMTLPQDHKDLLLYAMESASNAGRPGDWRYINGVLDRLRQRGIRSLRDAEAYDLDRDDRKDSERGVP